MNDYVVELNAKAVRVYKTLGRAMKYARSKDTPDNLVRIWHHQEVIFDNSERDG